MILSLDNASSRTNLESVVMPAYDSTTALIVVDVQNDFADPGGSLYVKTGEQVVALINDEIARAVAAGARVYYTQDWHPESTPHFAKDGGVWPVHCVMDTWGAELHPALAIGGPVVRKGSNGEDGYSGFSMRDPVSGETVPTPLGDLLAEAGVTRLVVCGLATDYCVKATVLDGRERGFPVTVLGNAIRAVDLEPGDGDRAVEAMFEAGALLESRAAVGEAGRPAGDEQLDG
jgi:nicotinamidase/pyrazinamidase